MNCSNPCLLAVLACAVAVVGETPRPLMPWSLMRGITEQHFASLPARDFPDLVVWEDLAPLLDEVVRRGWDMPYRKQISEVMVKESDFVATFARSKSGAKWLRSASGQKLLLDRVDRISRVSGGQEMLKEVAKLPNGSRYARSKPGGFVPDLVDLLPMKSGKRRKIPDYHLPTGRAYTAEATIKYLQQFHEEAEFTRRQQPLGR